MPSRLQTLIIFFLLFLLGLLPRFLDVDGFLNVDAANYWFARTEGFFQGLVHGDFHALAQSNHPGVTMMWLSGTSMLLENAFLGFPLLDFSRVPELLFWAKLPLLLLTALLVPAAFYILLRLTRNTLFAVAAALFMAIDPMFLSQSRFFQMNGLLGVFTILTLFAVVRATLHPYRVRWDVLTGVGISIAALTKIPGLVLLPLAVFCVWWFGRSQGARAVARRVLIILASALVTAVIVWPYLLVDLGGAMQTLFSTGASSLTIGNYSDASPLSQAFWDERSYYPLVLLLTPGLLLLGTFLAAALRPGVFRKLPQGEHRLLSVFTIFAVLFFLAHWVTSKQSAQYLTPLFLVGDVIAGYVFARLLRTLRSQRQIMLRVGAPLIISALFVVQVVTIARSHPYYGLYQNALAGAVDRFASGSWALGTGWGEGLEHAGAYVNTHVTDQRRVVSFYPHVLATWTSHPIGSMSNYTSADLLVLYHAQVRQNWDSDLIRATVRNPSNIPLFVHSFRGKPYIWVYDATVFRIPE